MHFDGNSIFNNLVSSAIWFIVTAVGLLVLPIIKKLIRPYIISFTTQIYVALFISYAAILGWVYFEARVGITLQSYLTPLLIIGITAAYIWWVLRGFQTAQIAAAFPTTSSGISYSVSLKLVKKSLDFMGIGAAKLTSDPEFEGALGRCADLTANAATVRLLLASPEHPIISKSARANSVKDDEYRRNVTDSLQKIARIAEARAGVIQVKHYGGDVVKDYPQFRLMFVDNEFCLFSWTVWDKTKGNNNPQMILRRGDTSKQKLALYKSYQKYFDDLWELGSEVDLSKYLE